MTVEPYDTSVGLRYSEVDIRQNGGLGRVTSYKNIQLLADTLCEKVSAVRHGNGRDWWVICRSLRQGYNRFYTFLLTTAGWEGPYIQDIGTINSTYSIYFYIGEAEFSLDGSKYVCVSTGGQIDLFDFERCSGALVSYDQIGESNIGLWNYYGVSFSPDRTKLYVSNFDTLFQFDLQAQDVKASRSVIWIDSSSTIVIGQHQLGPDGKIYIATSWYQPYPPDTAMVENQNLTVINSPNLAGAMCNISPYSISLYPGRSWLGLPNNPNYSLGPLAGSACDTLSVGVLEPEKVDVQIHPNPNSGLFTLEFEPHGRDIRSCIIKDMTGRTIFKEAILPGQYRMEIDIAYFVDGVYFVELCGDAGIVFRSKVVVQK